ncbi:MAG: PASTA domain-containing protein [Acidobacteria bacterium]|nr:PASTA domain-containing protein [Acidobacteriota bacterium]MBI3663709.1 PASTA domain-containing protein [Acidobacteriota bacterium]
MTLGEKVESYARIGLRVFILLAVAFLSAITAIRFAIQGREVEVPKLVSLKAGDAQTLLDSRRLGMKIADRVYSELPADYVVRQSPPAGSRVKVQQRAHVVLSLGPQKVSVPALVGETVRSARIELLRAGLQVGEISSVYLPDHALDEIVLQNPPPLATNTGSPRVNLLVSLGERPAEYVMPDLAGLPLAEAQRRIGAAGLHLAKISFAVSPEQPKGVVFQVPPRGARVVAGTNVELQVVE